MRLTMRSRLSVSFGTLGKDDIFFFDSSSVIRRKVVGRSALVVSEPEHLAVISERLTTNDRFATWLPPPSSRSFSQLASQTARPQKSVSRTRWAYAPCQDRVLLVRPGVRLPR